MKVNLNSIRFKILPIAMLLVCTAPAWSDASFDAFWLKFKTAVAKKDKESIASMTKLPYLLDSKQLNKAQFIAKCDELFPKSTVSCFTKAKPIVDQGNYLVFCGEQIYCFNKVNGKWMFTEIGVND